MRKIAVLSLLGLLLLSIAAAAPQAPSTYAKLKADAEREYAEKSFRRAHELYEQAAKLDLPPDERRWVTFRLADTELRALQPRGRDQQAVTAARETLRVTLEVLSPEP